MLFNKLDSMIWDAKDVLEQLEALKKYSEKALFNIDEIEIDENCVIFTVSKEVSTLRKNMNTVVGYYSKNDRYGKYQQGQNYEIELCLQCGMHGVEVQPNYKHINKPLKMNELNHWLYNDMINEFKDYMYEVYEF